MKNLSKRMVAAVAALSLLVVCALTGLVLPVAAEATELFANGDFEGFGESTPVVTPWKHVTGSGSQTSIATVQSGAGIDGSWGLRMGSTVGTAYVAFDSRVALESGATYRLSWLAKTGNAGQSVSVSLNSAPNTTLANASVKLLKSKVSHTVGEWLAYYIDFTAGEGAYIHDNGGIIIQRHTADSADICFDNFSIKKIDEDEDLVLHSDFETAVDSSLYSTSLDGAYGLLSNASKAALVQESATNRAMLLKASANGWVGGYFNGSHFVGGESYRVSFDYKGGAFRFYANPAAHGSLTEREISSVAFGESEDWAHGEFLFNFLPNGNNNWAFCFEKNSGGNHVADTYIDNLKIVKAVAPAATAIALDKTTAKIAVDETVTLNVTTEPANAAMPAITWESNNTAVATVTNGVVKGITDGEAVITATAAGLPSVSCTVTVKTPIVATGLTLNRTQVTAEVGGTVTLTAGVQPEGAELPAVTWESSAPTVVSVTNGVLKLLAEGSATVTASAAGLPALTCQVTVTAKKLLTNGTFEQDATDGWGGNSGVVAGVGKDGSYGLRVESTLEEGEASKSPGVYYKDKFNELLEAYTVYRLSFDYKHEGKGLPQFDAVYGGTDWEGFIDTDLTANTDWKTVTIEFVTGALENMNAHKGWEWQIRMVHHAREDQYGTGVLYADNVVLTKVRTVEFADELVMAPAAVEILPFGSVQLKVNALPSGTAAGRITWESNDPAILQVDQNGLATALAAEGTATVTARNQFGKTVTATVTITEYANQFQNGDFEQGGQNWNNVPNIKEGIGKNGSYGLELIHSDGASSNANSRYYKKALQLEPSTTYYFSVDYLATEGCSFRFWSYGFGLKNPQFEKGDGTTWKTASIIFTTPADMRLNTGWDFCVVCDETGRTPAVIDNLVLRKYSTGVQPQSVAMSLKDVMISAGRTEVITLHATPMDADLNNTVWVSGDENVVTVEYGVLMGVGQGTTTVTATTRNGKTATCTVTVTGDAALVKNGTFDIQNDSSWTLDGGATLAAGEGRNKSNALSLTAGGTATQAVGALKARKTYQLHLRYRAVSGTAKINLGYGSTVLLNQTTSTGSYWQSVTYEFTTSWRAVQNAVLTLSTDSAGPVYIDSVVLAEKASLIDLEASSVVWSAGEQVKPGTEMTFAVTVVNRGAEAVPVGSTFTIEICKNAEVFQTMEFTCTDRRQLEHNESVLVENKQIWIAEEGDYVISARVNLDQKILEMDVDNNTCQGYLRVSNEILKAPKLPEQLGMTKLTFSDEFNSTDSIDMYATGKDGYKWYVNRQWSASSITPQDYTVKDGVITLHANEPTYNITLSTMDADTGVGFSYRMGYLETRIRIPKPTYDHTQPGATGGIPAIWSFPENKWLEIKGENTQWVEIDWLEYWGLDTEKWPKYPDGYYTVTLHDQMQGKEGKADHWYSNGNSYQNGLGDGEWHTMGWVWANDIVVTYVDNVEVMRLTYDLDSLPNVPVRVQEGLLEDGAFTLMNYQYAVLYLGGAVDNPLEVDYVHIWQGGDGFIVMPGEGEQETRPDMDAEKFWHNYCTDKYGDAILKVTTENAAEILGGKALWEQLSVERRQQIDALLKQKGQKTFEELLKEAADPPPPPKPENKVEGLTVLTLPKKTTYILGEKWNAAGLTVEAVYTDGSKTKPKDFTTACDLTKAGVQTVTVSYGGQSASFTVTVIAAMTGDANGDRKVTITDMLAVKAHLLGKSTLTGLNAAGADTNKDGKITITDFIQVKAFLLGKAKLN